MDAGARLAEAVRTVSSAKFRVVMSSQRTGFPVHRGMLIGERRVAITPDARLAAGSRGPAGGDLTGLERWLRLSCLCRAGVMGRVDRRF